jgi:hypothetical protein
LWAGRDVHPGGGLDVARASGGLHRGERWVHDFIGFSLNGGMTPVSKSWWSSMIMVVGECGVAGEWEVAVDAGDGFG